MKTTKEGLPTLMNAWVNLTCPGEYDRIGRYMMKRVGDGRRAVATDFLTGIKLMAMNFRRGSAVAAGTLVGLTAAEAMPELVRAVSPAVILVSVATLGLNWGIDRLMDKEL